MNHMLVDSPDAPWNEKEYDYPFIECPACFKVLDEADALDPCYIDGRPFCDKCASNLVYLKIDGYIKNLKPRTEKLLPQTLKLNTKKTPRNEITRVQRQSL